jgi:hypothetical protein
MRRTCHDPYARSNQPAYIVLKDMQHQVIEAQRLEPAADLSGAMAATIERLAADGWQAEGSAEYGFVFIRREGERRLLMLAERDSRYLRRRGDLDVGATAHVGEPEISRCVAIMR